MRRRIGWRTATILALALALTPGLAFGQVVSNYNYEVPASTGIIPGPFGRYRMEEGGAFVYLDIMYWTTNIALRGQTVGVRGFMDFDGSITGATPGTPGTFVGSGDEALNTRQLKGPYTSTMGTDLGIGWRFESGVVLTTSWIHLWDIHQQAEANIVPPGFKFGNQLSDTFLFAPVVNFNIAFAGAPQNVDAGNPGATFGIWNAAQQMQIQLLQRFDQWDATWRLPMWDTDTYRTYALIGPRLAWVWDQFKWRTVSADVFGNADSSTTARYTNTVSNRLYGLHIGCGNEWFLGDTPAGAFSVSLDTETGLFMDIVKARAAYDLENRSIGAHRTRKILHLSPLASAKLSLWWYPFEAVQVQLGYDFLSYFNLLAGKTPIDFDYSALSPKWDTTMRYFQGIRFGVGIAF